MAGFELQSQVADYVQELENILEYVRDSIPCGDDDYTNDLGRQIIELCNADCSRIEEIIDDARSMLHSIEEVVARLP